MRTPRFFYFDLGNVLVHFDHEIACGELSRLTGHPQDSVREILFGADSLQFRYEAGGVNCEEFCQELRQRTDSQIADDEILYACSAIFWPRTPIIPVVATLHAAGYRLGILSNTCRAHWTYIIQGRYQFLLHAFEHYVLSFEEQSMKPEQAIYEAAARRAGVAPAEIFFTDDRLENVEGAAKAGWQAHHFTGVTDLIQTLYRLGVRTNL